MLFMIASIFVPFMIRVFSTVALSFDEIIFGGEAAKLITKRM